MKLSQAGKRNIKNILVLGIIGTAALMLVYSFIQSSRIVWGLFLVCFLPGYGILQYIPIKRMSDYESILFSILLSIVYTVSVFFIGNSLFNLPINLTSALIIVAIPALFGLWSGITR